MYLLLTFITIYTIIVSLENEILALLQFEEFEFLNCSGFNEQKKILKPWC
jgi:hypothetical protein